MWAFLSARLRLWLLLAVGVPALSWLLGAIGDRLEARNGPTTTSRALKKGRDWLRRRARGPLAATRVEQAVTDWLGRNDGDDLRCRPSGLSHPAPGR